MDIAKYTKEIFKIKTDAEFERLALQAFAHQKDHCKVYREYLQLVGKKDFKPTSAAEIPFLPIQLFKSRQIISEVPKRKAAQRQASQSQVSQDQNLKNEANISDDVFCKNKNSLIFTSSATAGMIPSKHYVADVKLYEQDFLKSFEYFYGNIKNYNLLALLPSYLERKGSSLVYMSDRLINKIKDSGGEGGFYLYNHEKLLKDLTRLCGCAAGNHSKSNISKACEKKEGRATILLGVSFALLDFVKFLKTKTEDLNFCLKSTTKKSNQKPSFANLIIMETGGMKGRGKELTRKELHNTLATGFGTSQIHSEYGMAELLSQAYSLKDGKFQTPPWMKIFTRDLMDPFKIVKNSGGINIIDLANINSCCFIETEDRGTVEHICGTSQNGRTFTIDGRIKNSELRGCNMLITG